MSDLPRRTLALDGLRGIAVVAVVIEHAWPRLLPGGFAGVDMFFVLSGYLITGLLVRELSVSGRINLTSFYARRVRRIVPASLVCVAGIWVGYTLLLGPSVPDALRPQALSATFSISNFYFARTATGYFDADPTSSPYLHFWSLAVEEQFYLVWPTALLIVAVVTSRLTSSPVARLWIPVAVLAAAGLVSLALALWTNPTYAFYLLPQRGWELIVGGLLAWIQGYGLVRLAPSLAPLRIVGVVAGALLVTFVLLTAPSLGRWPGPGTVLVVIGTALLVAGGDGAPGARMLRTPPLRFMGRISYSLYLWHWPLIAAAGLIVLPTSPATDLSLVIAVVAAIGVATASTLWMEEPIRVSRLSMLRGRKAIGVAVAATCLIGLSIATLTIPLSRLVPGVEPLGTALVGARDDRERIVTDACRTGKTTTASLSDCLYGIASLPDGSPTHGDPGDARVAVLFGDSHASHWFPAVNAWAKERGLVLVPLLRAACSPVDAPIALSRSVTAGCQKWRAAALDRIRELKPVVSFTSTSTASILMVDGMPLYPRGDPERWIAPAVSTFRRLAEIGPTVFLGDVPRPDFWIPDCLGVHRLDPSACARDLDLVHPPALVAAEAQAARDGGVWFFDPGPSLCPDGRCTWIVDGRVGWVDNHHLSVAGVMALQPMLEPLFEFLDAPDARARPATGHAVEARLTAVRRPRIDSCRDRRGTHLDVLREGDLIVGRIVGSSNNAMLVTIARVCPEPEPSMVVDAIYKPTLGERPLDDFPDGTLARREVAAWHVSEASGWGIVPPTILRDGPFGEGMVQAFIEADPEVDVVAMVVEDDARLRRMAVLDAVMNNTDRKGGHILPVDGGSHVYGVDHGVTFSPVPKLRTVLWGWRGTPLAPDEIEGLERVRDALTGELGETLGALLSRLEVRATVRRTDALLTTGRFPYPSPDWPAIPWPPF